MKSKSWKNLIIAVGALLVVFFADQVYLFVQKEISARENRKNIENVEFGMNKKNVLLIMGAPDQVRLSFLNQKDSMYFYFPPFGSSEGIYIQFDSGGKVNKVEK